MDYHVRDCTNILEYVRDYSLSLLDYAPSKFKLFSIFRIMYYVPYNYRPLAINS